MNAYDFQDCDVIVNIYIHAAKDVCTKFLQSFAFSLNMDKKLVLLIQK